MAEICYSIVVPCYRAAAVIEELVDRTVTVMAAFDRPFEIILVNDASPDNTWQHIRRCAEKHACVRGLDLMFNVGQFRATLCGFEHALGEFVLTMDDDLQHPPEEVPKLIQAIESHPEWDAVLGKYEHKQHHGIRNLGSFLWMRLNRWLFDVPADLRLSSFRILRAPVAKAMLLYRTAQPILGPLLLRTTRRIGNVTVRHEPRGHGRSGHRLTRLIRITVDNIVATTVWPLHVTGLFGLFSAGLSFLLGVNYLVRYLVGLTTVSGFTTITLLVIFFGGATLTSISILGEYIVRIVHEVSPPPRYVVREAVGKAVPT